MNDQTSFFSNCAEIENAIRNEDPALFDRIFFNQARDLRERIPAELDRYIQNCKFVNRLPTLEGAHKWILGMKPGHGVRAGWSVAPSKIDEKAETEQPSKADITSGEFDKAFGFKGRGFTELIALAMADVIGRNVGGIRDTIASVR